jgi:hypothetical protein
VLVKPLLPVLDPRFNQARFNGPFWIFIKHRIASQSYLPDNGTIAFFSENAIRLAVIYLLVPKIMDLR